MTVTPIVTRFAPSPTGRLHIGNARTALFNWLLAVRRGGEMILRIEDTDRERSRTAFERDMFEELRWLGLDWRQGPDTGGRSAPYRQSERQEIYDSHYRRLEEKHLAYPCFCSPEALKVARKTQLAAGKPPRYAGVCAHLDAGEIAMRYANGEKATLRFRVADGETVSFDDIVRGEQRFETSDIGDFVIRRADGSPSFFFANAVDDALMGVTHALRGEDHLANTPRQLLLQRALDLPSPRYGHFPLVHDIDGGPLSKRLGSLGLADLRARGFLPLALANYLARLGHSYAGEGFKSLDALGAEFDAARFGRAPAKYDPAQLDHWQKEAIQRLDDGAILAWLSDHASLSAIEALVPVEGRAEFVAAVRDNIVMPEDAAELARAVYADDYLGAEAEDVLRETPVALFECALAVLPQAEDFRSFAARIGEMTGSKGKALFKPLRAVLTGLVHGPEMARLWTLLGRERIQVRLAHAIEIAGKR